MARVLCQMKKATDHACSARISRDRVGKMHKFACIRSGLLVVYSTCTTGDSGSLYVYLRSPKAVVRYTYQKKDMSSMGTLQNYFYFFPISVFFVVPSHESMR